MYQCTLRTHIIQISCYAQNLRYEIPMVFVNSTPLIDAVERMGIPTVTNFYTNPINVTMMSRNNFSGTVQVTIKNLTTKNYNN